MNTKPNSAPKRKSPIKSSPSAHSQAHSRHANNAARRRLATGPAGFPDPADIIAEASKFARLAREAGFTAADFERVVGSGDYVDPALYGDDGLPADLADWTGENLFARLSAMHKAKVPVN